MSVYDEMSETQQFACRVIADHARSTAFAIADGILPGNEGRNYVLRKIMRRAIYHGREHLNLTEPFFYKVCDFVVDNMHGAFPELETQREFIGKMVRLEEGRFGNTLTVGLKKISEAFTDYFIDHCANRLEKRLGDGSDFTRTVLIPLHNDTISKDYREPTSTDLPERFHHWRGYWRNQFQRTEHPEVSPVDDGPDDYMLSQYSKEIETPQNIIRLLSDLAKLYDTYGVPKDLILVTVRGRGFELSDDDFDKVFDSAVKELQESSQVGKTKQADKINPIYVALERTSIRSNFHGYEATKLDDAEVVALVNDDKRVEQLNEGDEGLIVLKDTPFYAESGGQVGDTGALYNTNVHVNVRDTFAPIAGIVLHKSKVERGAIKVGDTVTATVDVEKRDATRRNHTATHLVHAALKEVLGSHVKQAGSVVAPSYLRFDFTHYQPMTDGEVSEIEDLVNRYIMQNEPVTTNMMALEDAMRSGAVAMFGEKYGSEVRVLSVGDGAFSRELCGGTHVRATGDIGSFKITSDEAIASGVRRIRAITGFDSFERFREDERLIDASLGALNTQRDNLPNAIARLAEELKKTRKEMDELKLKIATGSIGGGASSSGDEARDINGVKVLAKTVDGLDANGTRQLSDTLLARLKSGVVVLGRANEGKVSIIVRVSDDLTDKVKAGNIIKEIVPIVGGRGGGKADMAEGGGTEPDKLSDAIEASYGVIEKMLK